MVLELRKKRVNAEKGEIKTFKASEKFRSIKGKSKMSVPACH